MTRVRDIARVEVGAADYGSTSYMDRSNAAPLVIYAQPGANSVAVDQEVRDAVQALKKNFPPGVDATIIYDPNVFISKSIHEVIVTIFVAILLVVGVVFLFLQNWRATIIPVVAIPVSLVGAFTILAAFGISLTTCPCSGWCWRSESSSTTRSSSSRTSSATSAPACCPPRRRIARWTRSAAR